VVPNHLPFTTGRPVFSADGVWLALPEERQSDEDGFLLQQPGRLIGTEVIPGLPVGFLNAETLLVWDRNATRWQALSLPNHLRIASGKLNDLEAWNWAAMSEDGRVILAQAPGDRLEAIQVETGKTLARLDQRTDGAAMTADGSLVAVCLSDGPALWTPKSGMLRRIPGWRPRVAAISPNGAAAAFGDDRGQIRLWRPLANQMEEFPSEPSPIRALSFGGEDRTLFVANSAGLLQALHLGTRQELFSRTLNHSAEWLVAAPNDAGLLIGYPAPAGEAAGANWWWPVSSVDRPRAPVRPVGSPTASLPPWLKPVGKK
jgi:hypothetical protein